MWLSVGGNGCAMDGDFGADFVFQFRLRLLPQPRDQRGGNTSDKRKSTESKQDRLAGLQDASYPPVEPVHHVMPLPSTFS